MTRSRASRPLATRFAASLTAGVLLLSGCKSLPTSGPSNGEVLDQAMSKDNPLGIRLVDLSPQVVAQLRNRPERFMSVFDGLRSSQAVDRLGPGDVISVSIYEAGDGLFNSHRSAGTDTTSSGSSAETLPRLQVDRNGLVAIPYAGQVRVSGRTTTEVQHDIEGKLAEKASQPQVVVTLVTNGSNIVYVSGDVKASGRYPLTLARERLLDVIALSGGPTHTPQDTQVKLSRQGREATTSLTRLQTIGAENIAVEPGDRIQVDYLPRSYVAYGATGRVAQINFDAATVSLAEAVARAGGLDDNRANPEAVFLFRFERPANAQVIGLVPPGPVSQAPVIPGAVAQGIPVIYRVNMREPQTFFAIQQFPMQDKDLLYIANAPTVQLYKFLQLIYTIVTPVYTGKVLAQ